MDHLTLDTDPIFQVRATWGIQRNQDPVLHQGRERDCRGAAMQPTSDATFWLQSWTKATPPVL